MVKTGQVVKEFGTTAEFPTNHSKPGFTEDNCCKIPERAAFKVTAKSFANESLP